MDPTGRPIPGSYGIGSEEHRREYTILTGTADDTQTVSYIADRVVGTGSFGVVYQARVMDTNEVVAIKKVLQDRRFKNRELQIMRQLSHPNIVRLMHCFYSHGDKSDEVYLNLVLEYIPDTLYRIVRSYAKMRQTLPMIYVKCFAYQMLRGLGYMHAMGTCHRDIKPQNLLVDRQSAVLKICDFGSAKQLVKGEPNVSYISSRYYRAPELIFGSTLYSVAIDVWSAGCVVAEMLLGQPLFAGGTGVDQVVEIIKVMGTPTREEMLAMSEAYKDFKFPPVERTPWRKVFRPTISSDAIDLVSKLLVYTPQQRLTAFEALAHPFFDDLRDPTMRLPNTNPLPPLFDFSERELSMMSPSLRERLQPRRIDAGPPPAVTGSDSASVAPVLPVEHVQPSEPGTIV